MSDTADQYDALTAAAGIVPLTDWTLVELTGEDRAAFFHSFCTNEIRKLPIGSGCEAFITSVQGKVLAHVFVLCLADSLLLVAPPNLGDKIVAHLDRYLINEQVELHERTGARRVLLCAGAKSEDLLSQQIDGPLPEERLASMVAEFEGHPAIIARVDLAGPKGFLVVGDAADVDAWASALQDAGAASCGDDAWQAARIEAGTPLYGCDITDENLPQEVGRDGLAISFVKGCYLGQETVARIDSMGHVNKKLVGLRSSQSETLPPGTELTSGDKIVGTVTSSAYSPRWKAAVALAQVRRQHDQPGSQLESTVGEMEVVALPM
jgi:folate-binding protein YgfZ